MKQEPYICVEVVTVETVRHYNPDFGDDRVCQCGHSYYRHFDPYEEMRAVGCKYCRCYDFVEGVCQEGKPCLVENCGGVLAKRRPERHNYELVCTTCWTEHATHRHEIDHPDWLLKTPEGGVVENPV